MDLTELEQRLLKTISATGARMTVEELADAVGCQASTIYRRLQNKNFKDLFVETMKTSLTAEVPGILKAFVGEALSGSFRHGKLLLEIAKVYTEEKKIVGDIGVREGETPFQSAEERQEWLQATLGHLVEEEN